jgi:hypothetical protein
MSEGYLSWNTLTRSPLRAGLECYRSDGSIGTLGQIRLPSEYRSFVSGPSYDRLITNGGATLASQSLNETFSNDWSGDTGHEYMKKRIKRWDTYHNTWYSTASRFAGYQRHPWIFSGGLGETAYQPQFRPEAMPIMTDNQLAAESTGFLAGTMPLQSQADILQAVLELLREGLPDQLFGALVKAKNPKKSAQIKALAGDYLNYVFGISPIVREADKVIRTILSINQLIDQWFRDNRLDVSRRRDSKPEVRPSLVVRSASTGVRGGYLYSSSTDRSKPWFVSTIGSNFSGSWSVEDHLVTKERMHFSAMYNYDLAELALPGFDSGVANASSVEQRMALAAYALGISPAQMTPSLVWELTPFSWLVDWFTNVGQMLDVSSTLNQAGLHVRFAYLTVVQEWHWEQRFQSTHGTDGTAVGHNVIDAFYMRRLRATPFGFSTSFETLNPMQSSILAALAASKGLKG